MRTERLWIEERFCGPPGVANGGYLAGRLSRGLPFPVEVTLRAPTPLGKPLELRSLPEEGFVLCDGRTELATAIPKPLELEVPEPPSFEQAERTQGSCRALKTHPFPACFVCGPNRAEGDGLRILPGVLQGRDAVAAPWIPPASLADASGRLLPEFVWAALDCTSSFPLLEDEVTRRLEPMVLGRLTADLQGSARAGRPHVVAAWSIKIEGRRGWAGSALFDESGRCIARARATWISLAGSAGSG